MKVFIDTRRCVGCRICELACSFHKNKVFNPEYSKIRVLFPDNGELRINVLTGCTCDEKEKPLCIELCPTSAIECNMGNNT